MLPEHKNPIFVSKRPKISEKSPILTQKPRFCARKAGKWGPEAKKRTKMPILCSAEHGTSTERPGAAVNNHPKRNKTAWDEAQRPEAQRNATATQRKTRNGPKHNETQPPRNVTETQPPRNTTATQHTIHETQPLRQRQETATQWHNKKGDNLSGCLL